MLVFYIHSTNVLCLLGIMLNKENEVPYIGSFCIYARPYYCYVFTLVQIKGGILFVMFYLVLSLMWLYRTPSRSIINIRDVKACTGARIRRM